MADGRHGYDVSVGYPATFFPEMAPDWLDFCMRTQGFEPQRTGPSFRYADLGCGQGFHLCLLAAVHPEAEFVGVDFDSDIAHGQELAAAAGLTNISFVQGDFVDLSGSWPSELGTFDYLALQGVLSWVSPEVRSAAFQCVRAASKPGTIASFGYNAPPGWLTAMPFQHMANRFSGPLGAKAAIGGAITMFRRLRQLKAPLFERMPYFAAQLDMLGAQPTAYLAHEYLPDHWAPLWHSEVAAQLDEIGFTHVGTAGIAEALLPDALPAELGAIVREQLDAGLRQDVQDIVIMQQFRRDIFCRDPRKGEANGLDGEAPIHLISPPQEGAPVQFQTTFGGLTVDYAAIADIVAALADGPKTAAALMALENPARLNTRTILLLMLDAQILGIGSAVTGSVKIAECFNAAVAQRAAAGKSYNHLAAGGLGSGVPVAELDVLLLGVWLAGGRTSDPGELATGVAQRLGALGHQLRFRGEVMSDEQLQSHLAVVAALFLDRVVPQWRRLGVLQ